METSPTSAPRKPVPPPPDSLPLLPSVSQQRLRRFDAGFRRRLRLALLVSVLVNAAFFGGVSLVVHFLLTPKRPSTVEIYRIGTPAPAPSVPVAK